MTLSGSVRLLAVGARGRRRQVAGTLAYWINIGAPTTPATRRTRTVELCGPGRTAAGAEDCVKLQHSLGPRAQRVPEEGVPVLWEWFESWEEKQQ